MVLRVAQRFSQPLKIVFRYSLGDGRFAEVEGTADSVQTLVLNLPMSKGGAMTEQVSIPVRKSVDLERAGLLADRAVSRKQCMVKISYNARVDKVFQQEYRSPRPPYTSLEIPKQGIGQWCQPKRMVALNDSGFRAKITDNIFRTPLDVDFASPKEGDNICFTSLFDNYPDSVVVPLKGKARRLWLLMAGTTNNMQSRIDNAIVTVTYQDGSCDTLHLENPINWCPVEQDYYVDGLAFQTGSVTSLPCASRQWSGVARPISQAASEWHHPTCGRKRRQRRTQYHTGRGRRDIVDEVGRLQAAQASLLANIVQ